MNKQDELKQIEKLIKKFKNLTLPERRSYNEANTCKNFILPLFDVLGWDTRSEEIVEQAKVSGGRVDYAFKINGITKFFIEAKKFSVNLEEVKWAEQAIWYAYHKSVPWVVLTNFDSIKVFNAEWDSPEPETSLFFELKFNQYLENFEKLWLLSRESVESGELDKKALEWGKKPKTVSTVGERLTEDLLRWRDKLFDDLTGYNPEISREKAADSVQKFLNRLIFIRTCEDRGLEPRRLQEILRNWEDGGRKNEELIENLRKLFKEFNDFYDSKLFEDKIIFDYDKYIFEENSIETTIKETYKNSRGIRWNFDYIPADTLGTIYEQYLGHIQKGETDKKSGKRKSQGIYYTPRYIVDYIIENTLGEVLKGKTFSEILKIKVLDPACGSGSFLIKAFEVLYQRERSEGEKINKSVDDYALKMSILLSNIYGVDLDPEAVEIAQLNLLLKALNKRERLPNLEHNIGCGNSLISGNEAELKKYFGKNWKDKKPFNWEERLPEVFGQGGFDVIIGNPPYINVENLSSDDRNYLMSKYETAIKRFDIYIAFIEKGLKLLKPGGILSFIIPYPFLNQNYGEAIRKKILSDFNLLQILDLSEVKVFGDAIVRNCVIVIQKPVSTKNKEVIVKKVFNESDTQNLNNIPQNSISTSVFLGSNKSMFRVGLDPEKSSLLEKIEKKSIELGNICYVNWGARSGDIKKYVIRSSTNPLAKKMINARNIERYQLNYTGDYLIYEKEKLYNPMFEELFESPKLIVRDISGKSRLKITFDDKKYYAEHTVSLAVPYVYLRDVNRRSLVMKKEEIDLSTKYDPIYLLGNINSTLVNWFFVSKLGGGLHVYPDDVKKLPICKIDFSNKKEKQKHDELVKLADRMLKFNKDLQKLDPILDEDEYKELKSEIEKTDRQIDEGVYKLYGLTPEEIKTVEG